MSNSSSQAALSKRASSGAIWSVLEIVGSQFIRLASNLILTRLLFPEVFGLMALINTFIIGLSLFSDLGLNVSVIQSKRGPEPEFQNTAWTLKIIRGAILWIAAILIAIPLAYIYDEPMIQQLLPVAGITALIQGFSPTRVPMANRNLLLKPLTLIMLASQLIGTICMVALAFATQSVWALVFGGLIGELARLYMQFRFLDGQPNKLYWDTSCASELIRFGKWIFLSTICGFFVMQGDKLVLGLFISMEQLGIYNIGYFLAFAPLMIGRSIVSRVMLPLYRERPPSKNDANRLWIARTRYVLTASILLLNAMVGLLGVWLIEFLYDQRYDQAGPMLVLLSMSFIPMIIISSYETALLAAGDSYSFMLLAILLAPIQITLMYLGCAQFGIIGAVAAPTVASFIVYPFMASIVSRHKAWDPIHDIVFAVLGVGVVILTVYVHSNALRLFL